MSYIQVSWDKTLDAYIQLQSITIPLEPTNIMVSNITQTTATISWTGNSSANGYKIYDKDDNIIYNLTGIDSTSQVITGLTASAAHAFKVNAVNDEGQSDKVVMTFDTLKLPNANSVIGVNYVTPVTWSATDKGSAVTLSNGNLTISSLGYTNSAVRSTKGVSSGKWYWEVRLSTSPKVIIGIANSSASLIDGSETNTRVIYCWTGSKQPSGIMYSDVFVSNDIVGIALDMDGKSIKFYRNGKVQNNGISAFTDLASLGIVYPYHSCGDMVANLTTVNFGLTPFASQPPTGYLPLDQSTITPTTWYGMRRCNLSDAGVVNAYYGDASYKDDGTNGQVMVEIPKFWYKKNGTATGHSFSISDVEKDGYVVHPAFYRDRDGDGVAEEVNYRYFSAYEGVLWNGSSHVTGNTTSDNNASITETWKLCSVSDYKPYTGLTISNFRTIAQRRGNGWGITDFNLLSAVQMLYLVEYGHFDSQSKIGLGYTKSTNTASIITGKTSTLGNITGNESNLGTDGLHAMSYRGIENLYGNTNKFIDGLVTSGTSGSTPITIKIGNVGFNNTGSGYGAIFISPSNFTDVFGYISDIWDNNYLNFIPKVTSGSSTTKIYDQAHLYANSIPNYGGFWADATNSGIFSIYIDSLITDTNSRIGSRLSF